MLPTYLLRCVRVLVCSIMELGVPLPKTIIPCPFPFRLHASWWYPLSHSLYFYAYVRVLLHRIGALASVIFFSEMRGYPLLLCFLLVFYISALFLLQKL
jgi:hypothetical protein